MPKFNGHKNWTHWNVSLWINNDEGMYRTALDLVRQYGRKKAARYMLETLPTKTPDGATYSYSSIYAALEGMDE